MTGGILAYGLLAALAIALLAAAVSDLRSRLIHNRLTFGIAAAAPAFWWASGLAPWPGMAAQLALGVAAFAIFAGLFALRMMGGGDVKLLTALALWLPWQPFLELLVIMALLGGVLTIVFAVAHRIARRPGRVEIPYGVAIAGSGLWVLASTYGGVSPVTG